MIESPSAATTVLAFSRSGGGVGGRRLLVVAAAGQGKQQNRSAEQRTGAKGIHSGGFDGRAPADHAERPLPTASYVYIPVNWPPVTLMTWPWT